jgi:hypothetical protein
MLWFEKCFRQKNNWRINGLIIGRFGLKIKPFVCAKIARSIGLQES